MSTISHYAGLGALRAEQPKASVLSKFIHWCDDQEKNRLLWLAVALTVHGAALTPLILAVVLLTGFNFGLIILALSAMAIAVISNLAAMPTKITIPAFLLSVLIDLAIIAACVPHMVNAK